ncbi:MAG: chorismate synthase [Alistipes sp.]|nr:chorismate synthase [Alistipes sp.]
MNNKFGEILRVEIYGSSHAPEVGVIIEGIPAGMLFDEALFEADLSRRRAALRGDTPRRESDVPIIDGLDSENRTTGAPITIKFRNSDTRSGDYSAFERQPRPSHADLVQRRKYGPEYSIAGGGMASGRMTVALVAAGVVAKQLLPEVGFDTRLVQVGVERDVERFDEVIAEAARMGDSVGGIVECRTMGVPCSLGEPFFDSVESVMAHALFSIPGVKGVEFGDGFAGSAKYGSERNDAIVDASGRTATNNEGGINGGISNGNDIVVRVAIKPTPSISREQNTFNFELGTSVPLRIGGRHDSCIARRAAVVVEAMVALALADLKLRA